MSKERRRNQGCCSCFHDLKTMLIQKDLVTLVILIIVNAVNLLLVSVKCTVAIATGSFSLANSTLESFGDVFVGLLMMIHKLQGLCVTETRFPRGRNTEALTNVVAGVVMLVLASVNCTLNVDKVYRATFDPQFEAKDISVIIANILLKLVLFAICFFGRRVDQINVLKRDQLVDVVTNTAALIFAFMTKYIDKYFDVVGAVVILAVIGINWIPILFTNCNRIHGVAASEKKEKKIREVITESGLVSQLHRLVVYHRGEGLVVEVTATMNGEWNQSAEQLNVVLKKMDLVDYVYVFTVFEIDIESGSFSASSPSPPSVSDGLPRSPAISSPPSPVPTEETPLTGDIEMVSIEETP